MPMNPKLRSEWVDAGYDSRMGSAEVVPPPPPEIVRGYHLTSAEFGINNIALGRLKVARFSDLNDPFELLAVNFRENRTRNVVRNFKNAYDSQTGLLCFSANWTDPVLWSHYGGRHSGVCLGFDLPRASVQRVNYKDDRILAVLSNNTNPLALDEELQNILLCTKYEHWSYEQEIRRFVSLEKANREGRHYFWPFDQQTRLAEVILGPQCTLSVESVRKLVAANSPGATTYQARLAYKSFNVVPLESSVP